jgi:hypothetical protein
MTRLTKILAVLTLASMFALSAASVHDLVECTFAIAPTR